MKPPYSGTNYAKGWQDAILTLAKVIQKDRLIADDAILKEYGYEAVADILQKMKVRETPEQRRRKFKVVQDGL